MVWRAPWLQQRRALTALALLDCGVLITVYNLLFWERLGRWPGVSGAVVALVLVWLTFSYLLGRYSNSSTNKTVGSIVVVVLVVTGLTVGAVWLGVAGDERTLPEFLLPLLGWSATISAVLASRADRQTKRVSRWLLIANKTEQAIVEQELQRGSGPRLSLMICSDLHEIREQLKTCDEQTGISISERVDLDDTTVGELLQRRAKGQQVITLMDWLERHLQVVTPELLTPEWILMAEGFRLRPGQFSWRLKRIGDLCFALILLVTTSPLLLLGAMLIKLEDGGPILYSQTRTGLYEQPFKIWKLRSMRTNSEALSAQWASKGDPRITRIGGILRKLRIDELPQLFNVLSGDMSLIGPRPERPELEHQLENAIAHYRVRHWVRPGLSGWAQVCYSYGASIEASRIKLSYDLYYLRNFSLWLDLLILIKTIRLVSRGQGATPAQ